MSFFREVFGFKNLVADMRATVVSLMTTGAFLFLVSIGGAIWKAVKQQPVPWTVLILIGVAGTSLLVAAIVKLVKAEKKINGIKGPSSTPAVELKSDDGFICARVTNRSDSEVRVEDLWLATVDATKAETRDKIPKVKGRFKRCNGMPHIMAPRSSFEKTFHISEASIRMHAEARPALAVREYWIELKLEDGTIIPSEHREIAAGPLTESQQEAEKGRAIFYGCLEKIRQGIRPLKALQDVKAAFDTNDDLVKLYDDLKSAGVPDFAEDFPVPKEYWLEFLTVSTGWDLGSTDGMLAAMDNFQGLQKRSKPPSS